MKKLSNRLSVKQSSTKEGQRELLREHTNKINEIIDWITALEQREGKHELDVITSMQYLDKEIYILKENNNYLLYKQSQTKQTIKNMNKKQPYTAIRSTGEPEYCTCKYPLECANSHKPIKPQEDVKNRIVDCLIQYKNNDYNVDISSYDVAEKIIAIVKGE